MVIAAAVVALLGLGYIALWEPLAGGVVRLEQSVQAQRELKQWMQQSAAEVQRLRSSSGGAAPPSSSPDEGPRSLLSVSDEAVRQANLGPSVRRIEPDDNTHKREKHKQTTNDNKKIWLG